MGLTVPRHDAKYSPEVVKAMAELLDGYAGPIVDPFAGTGTQLHELHPDIYGIELEPEWAASMVPAPLVQGDALDPRLYHIGMNLGCTADTAVRVATSPVYGNRLADTYLGRKCDECNGTGDGVCPTCSGEGRVPPGGLCPNCDGDGCDENTDCDECNGTGRDPADVKRRFGYAVSLGRLPSEASSCTMPFENGPRGWDYRNFHTQWLRILVTEVLEPGPRRLVLNMKDHYRMTNEYGVKAQRRQYAVSWWLHACHQLGFRLTHALPANTAGIGYGANMQDAKADGEVVLAFDLYRDK